MRRRKPARTPPLAETFETALALHRQGRLSEAGRLYETMMAKRPADFATLYNLGLVRIDEGRLDDGADLFRRAVAAQPGSADAHNALGTALQRLERPTEAIAAYRAALAIDPRDANAHANLGAALATLDREAAARAVCEQALAIAPRHSGALASLGNVLKALGQIDEARATYERALAIAPRNPQLYFALSDTHRFAPGDPYLAAMETLAQGLAEMPAQDRIHLHFALGKAYDDCGAADLAFDHLSEGNRLKRASLAYDEAATLGWLARIRAAFTPALLGARAGPGNDRGEPSPAPVFVVGMPRSGTTLIEQILASHPLVFGAGEIEIFTTAVDRLADARGDGVRYPELAAALDGAALARLGADYVAATRALAPGAAPARITDKLPLNFAYVGLIHLALPNARIIHVQRDPVDTCSSCFSKLFTRANPYTYDLAELGRFYRGYAATMAHWRALLPGATLLEVRYEDVVADLEPSARRIVAHTGLAWDDACLAFHATRRAVRTASAVQVRRPLYGDAIGRARPYRHRLGPLLAALGG